MKLLAIMSSSVKGRGWLKTRARVKTLIEMATSQIKSMWSADSAVIFEKMAIWLRLH